MAVFVDAAHYIATLLRSDDLYERANRVARELGSTELVTTDAVFLEVLAHASGLGPRTRSEAAGLVDDVRADPRTAVVRITASLFDEGLALYRNRLDKGYSLADTIAMVVCRERGITQVLSHDHHFEQEGLTALLR